ncbi:flagellar hook-associated protein FlgK [Bryobacter aggregatus]|uniref:flagellar hook-associated protein FlgK n=1 Tax=Bryobacter aggregatus TaxID=360054 RepID=UPI0004E25FD5|nr:flagellar hook-associated protein FlgK [Bryobacter aggregatus]
MGNLFGSLSSTAAAMRAFERALATTQSNVVNINTPGYAKQRQDFIADRFDPARSIIGGVSPAPLTNYRDRYSEANVQRRNSEAGFQDQREASLSSIATLFPVTDGAGIPSAINNFLNSISQLTVAPNDASSRQVVLDRAGDVATSFQTTASQLQAERGNTQNSIRSTVDQINAIAATIQELNVSRRNGVDGGTDPGTDAKLYASLEELSKLVDFQAIEAPDGSMSVYLGGQSLLVIGNRRYELSTDVVNDQARIVDSDGGEITNLLHGGKVAALVDVYNNKLPSYLSDLDTLASQFADQVNQTLAQGIDQNGNAPTQDLFSYQSGLGAAYTFQVNALSTDQLALAGANQPGGNANAIALTQLAQGRFIQDQTFQQYYGTVAGRVGRDLSNAQGASQVQGDLLLQAKELRASVQGVSLDEEASLLIQYQRSYQASAQLFKTINEMTQTILNIFN